MSGLTYGQWLERGRTHQKEGRPVDAMLCFRQAARAEPRASDPRFHLGEVLWQLGLLPDAMVAWRDACAVDPQHPATHFALAEALLATGDAVGARDVATRVLSLAPENPRRAAIYATAQLSLVDGTSPAATAQRAAATITVADALRTEPSLLSVSSIAGPLAMTLDRLSRGVERDALVDQIVQIATSSGDPATMPTLLLALLCERLPPDTDFGSLFAHALERSYVAAEHDALRRIARVATNAESEIAPALAQCYASFCLWAFGSPMPLPWPRRTAGKRLRIVALVDDHPNATAVRLARTLASLPRNAFDVTLATLGTAALSPPMVAVPTDDNLILELPRAVDPRSGQRVAALDPDVLIDLVGLVGPAGPLLAQRPARAVWTVSVLPLANVAPLVDRVVTDEVALQAALDEAHASLDPCTNATADAAATAALWVDAVRAHQQGERGTALAAYARVLAAQPDFAPAHYLRGVACRDDGDRDGARASFIAAVNAAPDYVEARIAAAESATETHEHQLAVTLCEEGLTRAPGEAGLLRALGLAHLARRDGAAAAAAFLRALMFAPTDGETHYNHGVALQMQGDLTEAARAYQRALVFRADFVAADFNLGVLFEQQGATDAAVAAFEHVLTADPRHVGAYRNLGEVLLAAGRIDAWLANFARFEANCPTALPLAVQALEACQYLPDFSKLEGYLNGLRQEQFRASDELELADALEQLLYLLLYFDVEPDMVFKFAQTYDATAKRVYGEPLPRAAERNPGPLRLGYLSGDLRDHVQGKMVWQAVQHHDRKRFELYFYSLSTQEDEWTARFRSVADRYHVIAPLTERAAAEQIAADDLDLLIDLSTHTKGASPGILAFKPARVQITHVASSGTLGLSTIDFKLTDHFADVTENQTFQLETLLPMDGCVYPYRRISPATEHPFRRDQLGIAADAVVIGAFVSGLKLSRRCLSLWRDVLARIPSAKLAFSPLNPAMRTLYVRLAAAGGIAASRLIFLPQGRNDAENQARYELVDFVLDPMPYGGVNGTLEALDMGVPVVTLVGKRHGERTSYSILANLGVTQTVAHSGRDYVEIAARLAEDAAFMHEVRAAIRAGLAHSTLTDMQVHTRNLERAYLSALAQRFPAALAAESRGEAA